MVYDTAPAIIDRVRVIDAETPYCRPRPSVHCADNTLAGFSFAFGPTLLGQLQNADGSYGTGLLVCLGMEAVAAVVVIAPAIRYRSTICGQL
jgi:hypothetical protein